MSSSSLNTFLSSDDVGIMELCIVLLMHGLAETDVISVKGSRYRNILKIKLHSIFHLRNLKCHKYIMTAEMNKCNESDAY